MDSQHNTIKRTPKRFVRIPSDYMRPTLESALYSKNNLFQYLLSYLPHDVVAQALRLYGVGTCNHWKGSTAYWLVNKNNEVTGCKLTLHNKHSGKVVAPNASIEQYNPITKRYDFVSAEGYCAILFNGFDDYTKGLNLKPCFFGAHLISERDKRTIILTENESSAVVGSIYIPQAIWVAVGHAKFDYHNTKALAGRNVMFIPNYGGYSKELSKVKAWKDKTTIVMKQNRELKITLSTIMDDALAARPRQNQTVGEMLLAKNPLLIEQFTKLGFAVKGI